VPRGAVSLAGSGFGGRAYLSTYGGRRDISTTLLRAGSNWTLSILSWNGSGGLRVATTICTPASPSCLCRYAFGVHICVFGWWRGRTPPARISQAAGGRLATPNEHGDAGGGDERMVGAAGGRGRRAGRGQHSGALLLTTRLRSSLRRARHLLSLLLAHRTRRLLRRQHACLRTGRLCLSILRPYIHRRLLKRRWYRWLSNRRLAHRGNPSTRYDDAWAPCCVALRGKSGYFVA